MAAFRVVDDVVPEPLTATPGDAARGRAIALDRARGNCPTSHAMPESAALRGNVGPPLAGVAGRRQPGELRLRRVDSKRINPEGNMPSCHRVEGLAGAGARYRDRPILTAQEVEDVLACHPAPRRPRHPSRPRRSP